MAACRYIGHFKFMLSNSFEKIPFVSFSYRIYIPEDLQVEFRSRVANSSGMVEKRGDVFPSSIQANTSVLFQSHFKTPA